MKNKTVIIIGGSSGIGKAIAFNLKKQGANVVIVGCSPEKTTNTRGIFGNRALTVDGNEKGAETGIWLASGTPGKDFKPGEYYSNKKLGMLNKKANDPVLAKRLWERSEQLAGIKYPRG